MKLALSTLCLLGLGMLDAAAQALQADSEPIFICPLPKCGKCPSRELVTAPGVGFALEIGYGTASIKYNNGTVLPVVQVQGKHEYIALMEQLATNPINRMTDGNRPPPGVDESDDSTWLLYMRYQIQRLLNKTFRRAATPEIGILAEMVLQLRREVETKLGTTIKGVALASPDRVRLTDQEIADILDYLGMEDLVRDKNNPAFFSELFSTSAALAGYGVGLCTNYTNAYECAKEEEYAPPRRTLQLDFSNHSISGFIDLSNTARKSYSHNTFVDLTLGRGHLPKDSAGAEKYWDALETRIREFIGLNRPEALLLTGESAGEQRFIQVVEDALQMTALPSILNKLDVNIAKLSEHFLFATSKGAAEFAKRRQEGMARCWLPEECRGKKNADNAGEDQKEL